MQTASSRFRTRVTASISPNDTHYTTTLICITVTFQVSSKVQVFIIIIFTQFDFQTVCKLVVFTESLMIAILFNSPGLSEVF